MRPGIQEFSDTRDGNVYRYVSVGGTDWFVTNLAWRGAGVPYKESEVLWNVFGGYYTFDEVSSGDLCPEGWRVPSDADWRALGQALAPAGRASVEESEVLTGIAPAVMARAYFNNEKMWPYSPECDPDNASGISAVPAGYYSQTQFVGMNEYSAFWTSDTYSDTGCGIYRYMGNYSGVTVDAKEGFFDYQGYHFRLVDLPGTYSLSAYSPEELYVRKHIIEQTPDVIINVVDAGNLERNLYLTTQLIDMNVRMVIALNMYDALVSFPKKSLL